jgi:hypothetical protein
MLNRALILARPGSYCQSLLPRGIAKGRLGGAAQRAPFHDDRVKGVPGANRATFSP